MKKSGNRIYPYLLCAAVIYLAGSSLSFAQCDIDIPDLGCNNIDYANECIACAGQTGLALVQLYINFPDQGPLEDYGITVEYGNDTDGFETWTDDFYNSGGTIQFVIDTTTVFYLIEVVCPNGDIDTTDLGDTVTIFVEPTPFFDFPGNFTACDSFQLPPITGQNVPPDAAYFTLPDGQGQEFAPGDWVTASGFYYIFGQNGPCEGQSTFEVEIEDCGGCDIAIPDLSCSPLLLGGADTCEYCDDDAPGVIPPFYFNFSDQDPGETYDITYEIVTSGGTVISENEQDYTTGDPILFSTQDSFIVYLTSVECPNGEIDVTDLGDTIHIFVTRAPTFNQLGPVVDVCDSVGLPPIEGLFVPPDAAYYSESGGNGTQYMPGDWITESGIYYIYGTNGPCTGEIAFQINIFNSANAQWTPPDIVCVDDGPITLEPDFDFSGVWTGPGITDNGDGTATFDPDIAGTADAIITYTITVTGCSSFDTDTISAAQVSTEVLSVECNNNGTPSDDTDDFYDATVVITGTNTGLAWTSDDPQNPLGNFGDTVVFSSLPTNSTNIFTITDDATTCSEELTIVTGDPCGALCDIMIEPGDAICNSNDTWFDASDDLISQGLIITNGGAGGTFTVNDPNNTTGQFGTITVFGPYDTDGQDLVITITSDADPSCSIEWTIPHTCNVDCAIEDVYIDNVACNDGGTPGDPSDDYVTFTASVVSGTDLSDGWFITSDIGAIVPTFGFYGDTVDYQTEIGSAGTTDEIIITFIDFDNPECTFDVTIDNLGPCSDEIPCEITEAGLLNITCNDFGTPDIADDDFVEITLNPTGTGLSGSYNVTSTSVVVTPGTGTYGSDEPFQLVGAFTAPDPIIITITDADDPDCSLEVEVPNVTPCFDDCQISLDLLVEDGCNDNGTPNDPDDDTFSFQILINGTNTGTGWTANDPANTTGDYGFAEPFGPFLISDGIVSFTVTDNENSDCTVEISVVPPLPCSVPCSIDQPTVTNITCLDNGTPGNPDDDIISFDLNVSGSGVSTSGFTITSTAGTITPLTGQYDQTSTFNAPAGSAGGGSVTLTLTDNSTSACQITFNVDDPGSCSTPCILTADASPAVCDDNDTPGDPQDDLFTVSININGNGNGWTSSDPTNPSGAYGTIEFGPYVISDGVVEIIFTDIDNPSCTDTLQIDPPSTCSDDCVLSVQVTDQFCDDNGTPDISSDDVYFITVIVDGINSGTTWELNTQITASGEYGLPAPIGPLILNQATQFVFFDVADPDCSVILELGPLPGCSAGCPSADSTFLSVTTCDPLLAGLETEFFIGSDGCDSVVITETSLLQSDSTLITTFSCLTADTGIVEQFFLNSEGCDSIVINNIILGTSDTTFNNSFSCDPGDTISNTTVFTNSTGCDSVVVTSVALLPPDTTFLINQTCDPADSTIIIEVLQNSAGCDSVVIIEPVFVENDTILITSFSCDPGDTSINITVLTNSDGCDSVIIEQVLLSSSDSITIQNTSCVPADTGVTTTIFTNSIGCDSVVTISTTLVDADSNTINISSCNPQDTGTFIQTFSGQSGCDSIIITNISLSSADTTLLTAVSCNAQDTGVTVDVLISQFGCDSVIITNTLYQESDTTFVSVTSCSPLDTGVTVESLSSQSGCDSVVITSTVFIESDTTVVTASICPDESIEINGEVYDSSNTSGFTILEGQNGCDSVVLVEIAIAPDPETVLLDTILCPGESLVINGNLYDELMPSGTELIQSQETGCDSLLIEISILYDGPDIELLTTDAICQGQTGQVEIVSVNNLVLPATLTINNDSTLVMESIPYLIDNLEPGTYTFRVLDSINCEAQASAIVEEGDELFIDIDSIIIISGTQSQLVPVLNFNAETVSWSPAEFVDCSDCLSPVVIIDKDAAVTVQAFDENGCSASATVQLLFQREFQIFTPNVFTPNNDGVNDRFIIYTSDDNNARLVDLAVFDRWGAKVFEVRDVAPGEESNGWDGTHNGQVLDPGVFVFNALIESNTGEIEMISGDVTLIR